MTALRPHAGVRRWLGRIRRKLSSRRFVLVYHRVAEPRHDPWRLAVSPARFEEQLQVLRARGAVFPLGRMLRELDAGTLPSRAIAVTFDDGYADTLFAAKPLLERHDVPASVFLCPGLLDGRTPFWWDALARIVFEPEGLPPRLELRLPDRRLAWNADGEKGSSHPVGCGKERSGEVGPTAWAERARHDLYAMLCSSLRQVPLEAQRAAISELAAWAGLQEAAEGEERPLARAEAARLAEPGLIEIGCHTLTHASLPSCGHERKKAEIESGKAACEEIAGTRVLRFSFPYNDYDADAVALLRDAGFTSAWTTVGDSLAVTDDRFRLPRVPVQDWDGAQFERRLATADFA